MKNPTIIVRILLTICAFCVVSFAQTSPPDAASPKSVKVPQVNEFVLKNGLKVAVVERKAVPLVTVQLVIKSGADTEEVEKAGLADMTASLLTKGTKTRNATQIAEQMEFLGASLDSGANWNFSTVGLNVMSDKLDQALAIMADTVLNPAFKKDEIDLLKTQTLDGLTYNLTQPSFLANYVASAYSFSKHPAGGTVSSITNISRADIVGHHKDWFEPNNSVLIFTGDISAADANTLAQTYFGKWNNLPILLGNLGKIRILGTIIKDKKLEANQPLVKRILVVDLPNSGQASVTFARNLKYGGRIYWDDKNNSGVVSDTYYPATVLNSLLGGGYSSRLNQEIRIKRGLSYGAGSGFSWQKHSSDFSTRTQTKNESAAEVAELVTIELKKLAESDIPEAELNPRRLVLTGSFGRNIETNQGLATALADLYAYELPADTLNSYMNSVMAVKDSQIKQFAAANFNGGDIVIVGDYAKFKGDLAKRFPNINVEVVKADELDISKENLKK